MTPPRTLRSMLASRREWLAGIAGSAVGAAAAGAAVPASVPATARARSGVSPLDFEGDVHARMDAAITAAIERIEILDLRGLPSIEITRPLVLSRGVHAGESNWVAPKSVQGGGTHIVARAPMACMVEMRNSFGVVMQGLRFDGAGLARMVLDTSWTISAAPAANCRWSDLELRGAAGPVTWNARGNNDCDFTFIQIQGPVDQPAHVAIDLQCGGGDLSLFRVRSYWGKLVVAAQSITLTNCVTAGVRVIGKDFNLLSIAGGYHYPAADTRTNIDLSGPVPVMALSLNGAHLENGRPDGVILGGEGVLYGGITLIQCHIFAPGSPPGVRLIGPGLRSSMGSGVKALARLIGGTVQLVDLAETPGVAISCEGVNHDQHQLSRRRAGGTGAVLEDADAGLYRQEHPAWGPLAALRSTSTAECAPGAQLRVPLKDWPLTGRLFVRATGGGPRATFEYDIASATVTAVASYGAGGIRAAIRNGELVLAHDGKTTIVFLLAAIGL